MAGSAQWAELELEDLGFQEILVNVNLKQQKNIMETPQTVLKGRTQRTGIQGNKKDTWTNFCNTNGRMNTQNGHKPDSGALFFFTEFVFY